jgi:hypothetical protein
VEGFDTGKNIADFFNAENGGKASFILSSEDSENMPGALKDVFVEETYPAIADTHGIG